MPDNERTAASRRARFTTGGELFTGWSQDVRNGTGPVLYRHAFPYPEVGPGLVTLIGGAPSKGKTTFVTQMGVEIVRFNPERRVLFANCEMSPAALFNRQLARLSGIDAETVRYRRLGPENEERLAAGLATLESIADRVAFLDAPYDLANVAAAADDFRADVLIIDYVQRFTLPEADHESRHRVSRIMDYLRQFATAGVAVIVVSAVGRTKDKAGRSSYSGDGLNLASFRETSELEYGADDALILTSVGEDDSEVVQLSHLKARHGRQVTQKFRFNRAVQSFELLETGPRLAVIADGRQPTAATGARGSMVAELERLWATAEPAADEDAGPDADEPDEPTDPPHGAR